MYYCSCFVSLLSLEQHKYHFESVVKQIEMVSRQIIGNVIFLELVFVLLMFLSTLLQFASNRKSSCLQISYVPSIQKCSEAPPDVF